MGNIIGSNIANIGLILGVCGLVKPLDVTLSNVDIFFFFLSSLLLFLTTIPSQEGSNGKISRFVGFMWLFGYAEYIFLSVLSV